MNSEQNADGQNSEDHDEVMRKVKARLIETLMNIKTGEEEDHFKKLVDGAAHRTKLVIEAAKKDGSIDEVEGMLLIEAAHSAIVSHAALGLFDQLNGMMLALTKPMVHLAKMFKDAGDGGTVTVSQDDINKMALHMVDITTQGSAFQRSCKAMLKQTQRTTAMAAGEITAIITGSVSEKTKLAAKALADLASKDDEDDDDPLDGALDASNASDAIKALMTAIKKGLAGEIDTMAFQVDGNGNVKNVREMSMDEAMNLINGEEAVDPNETEDTFPEI